ncbi:Inner centromere protein, partial [Dryobates pubescens]
ERDEQEALQRAQDVPGTPKGLRLSRRSVRRSLLGRAPPGRGSSAAAKRCRSSRGGRKVSASAGRVATRARPRPSAASCADDSSSEEVPESEGTVVKAGPSSDPCSPPRQAPQSPPTSLGPQAVGRQEQQPQEPSSQERNSNKSGKTQEPPQSARRKPSYKRAVDECYDQQQAEEGGLSPPRKKTPSPTFPASKVVRPIKTFLHTVQKNQLLMTPSSLGGSMGLKSFIRHNTPLQTDPRERERQKLQVLKKKQEADELRKQRLEEEKKRRLDEAKLPRPRRLQLSLGLAPGAVQSLQLAACAQVREERLAEEKIRKRAAAKKLEEAEARRRQEEEARTQRALQQEEEERRHRELLQKRKEEEQEQARRILQQRQAEQEREKQLAAQRELERKKEQERIQAEKLREQQQKAACLQKEAQERLQKDEQQKEEHKKLPEEQQHKDRAQTQHPEEQKAKDGVQAEQPENPENSGACNSYQLTPHAQRDPKPFSTDPNNYGLDLNSDDSTDDESQPRKPIPAWASGEQLSQAVTRQYYNPPNVDEIFGVILSPRLEDIFGKSKPRYFKRTSSAVWSSPPCGLKPALPPSCSLKK